ncbi:hypothetical protein OIN60_17585 [Paenibacillus sp. P96]|uniref:Uncharacterized protein n=1 Tax=Paenibacillus zeirhizosphaerae TaxID=2987519 RepID=A0ABT9FVP1_9BACL|nr:hypothetical protein [Paenibacillus sp. P96]MDP4098547.1 hypothetical protein [Paenibacillus sp. P96]
MHTGRRSYAQHRASRGYRAAVFLWPEGEAPQLDWRKVLVYIADQGDSIVAKQA